MSQSREKVVLCKSLSNENETVDVYKDFLEKVGYNFEYLPTIRFEFINQRELQECLIAPDSFSGLILTSPRSAEVIKTASLMEPSILDKWKDLPTYCVGPSTETLAKKILCSSHCLGSQCGNSESLAKFITTNAQYKDKPMLYPCSEIARDTIEKHLTENGYKIKKVISYKTVPCENLQQDVERIFKSIIPQVVVFFSPSVVENLLSVLGEEAVILKETKIVAIGSVTGRALVNAGIVVDAISEKPEPEALLQAIERSIRKDNGTVKFIAETTV